MSRGDVLADYALELATSLDDVDAVLAEALVALTIRLGYRPQLRAADSWHWLDECAVRVAIGPPVTIAARVQLEPAPTGWFQSRRARAWLAWVSDEYGRDRRQLDGTFATADEAAAAVDAWLRGETSPPDEPRWVLVPGGLPERE